MKKVVFAISFICLLGCQKNLELTRYRWSSQDGKNQKPEIQSSLFGNSEATVKVFDEIVERSTQRVGGAIVEASFLQKVSSAKGQLKFLNAQFDENFDKNTDRQKHVQLAAQAEKLRLLRYTALEVVKRKYLDLKNANYIFEPEVILSGNDEKPKFQFQFEYIPQDGSGVYSLRVSPSYAIESIKRVEHCFQESPSLVFPVGPKLSDLIETLLRPLIGDGSLTSPRVAVSSEDGEKVIAENGGFLFGPEDPRFDHVQAFFFAQKTLSYAETHWDLSLPFPVKIGLRAGFPKKTNTAYYYKGLVRLGEGDGVGYKGIPRDPSIVSHEVAHAIIDSLSAMGTEGETASLNEGFADYLTASLWENPELGHTAFMRRPFTRTVNVKTTFGEKNGGLYHDSGILSGTLWDIEKQIGAHKTQVLALKAIVRLGAQPHFADVRAAFSDAMGAASFSTEDTTVVLAALDERGWPLAESK
jgi:hypothetical protein